jgi:hypothetical protein
VYCFSFNCIVFLYVNVWSVENEPFCEFIEEEDFEDSEQFSELVEGKSLLHSRLSYTTCILVTLFIYLSLLH